jgi:hypothetical protein
LCLKQEEKDKTERMERKWQQNERETKGEERMKERKI